MLIPVSAHVSPPPPGFGRVGLHKQPNDEKKKAGTWYRFKSATF